MILYLDTSSLIKLYVEETGTSEVRQIVEEASVVATSVVAYPEARAALAEQQRMGGITRAGHARARAALDRDWPRLLAVGALSAVCREAGDLAEKHRIRGFDSIHLASSLWLARQTRRPVRFSSFDAVLNRAARRELGPESRYRP